MAGHGPHPRWRSRLERWLSPLVRAREAGPDEGLAEAARELYRSEARRARVLEAVPDGICVSRDGRVVYANLALARLVGVGDPAQAIGRPTLDFVDADFHAAVRQGREVAANDVLHGPSEIRLRRIDGALVPAELRVVAVDDGNGDGRSFLNVIRDLTAEKAAETQTRLMATVLEQSTDGVMIVDDRGRIVYVNPAFCELRGRTASELIGGSVLDSFLDTGAEGIELENVMKTLLAGETWRGRYRLDGKDGACHRDTRCFPVRNEAGEIQSFVALVRDTNQEVELEQRAEQARKLEAVGQLAGGLAHDVNNLLTVILGQLELLSIESPDDPAVREHSQAIGEAVERSASRVRQILAFGRRRTLDPRVVDVAQVIRDQRALLEELVPGRIALVLDVAASLPPVRIDPAVIQQALNELVLNARDAIAGSGAIRISAASRDDRVVIRVEDDGVGMDEATRARVFEPYFTTGDAHASAGLGLATIHGLVTQSGGGLELDSEPGRGTRVELLLPEARPTARTVEAPQQGPVSSREASEGGETLLLVEDEDRLRALARRSLMADGYRVLEACDGTEALGLAAAHRGDIHLLVCDVILPGIDGVVLAATLRRQRPALRVLLMSGYAPESTRKAGWSDLDALFLEKPFRMQDLRAHVREALDAVLRA